MSGIKPHSNWVPTAFLRTSTPPLRCTAPVCTFLPSGHIAPALAMHSGSLHCSFRFAAGHTPVALARHSGVLAYTFHVDILRLLILLLYLALCRMPPRCHVDVLRSLLRGNYGACRMHSASHVDMLRSLLSCPRYAAPHIAAGFFASEQKENFLCPFCTSPMLRGAPDVGISLLLLHVHSLEIPLPRSILNAAEFPPPPMWTYSGITKGPGVPLIAHN